MDVTSLAKAWSRRAEARQRELDAWRESAVAGAREAARVLRVDFGATEVWLFGSAATGRVHERSDVDLAVSGVPHDRYFRALARIAALFDAPVDLVPLESASPALIERIRRDGVRLDV